MSDAAQCRPVRLARPGDIPRLVTGNGVHQGLPPPDTSLLRYYERLPQPIGYVPWMKICGDPSEGAVGDWWTEPLSEVWIGTPDELVALTGRLAANFTGPLAAYAGTVASWPVIYEQGGAGIMRWIRATLRGELSAGVEQFQHKIDLGNPGADPDITEVQALALAEQLAVMWSTAFNAVQTGSFTAANTCFPPQVRYTEVGVVQLNQSDPGNSDGSGGEQTPSFGTQWFAWTTKPTGTSGTSLPFEVSCAVTLQTDTRGASGRGRMYLPPFTTGAMGDQGLFMDNPVYVAGNMVGDFLTLISSGTPYEPIVVSKRQRQLREITEVNVGKVPDSQRRRRRNQDEARITLWTKP